METANRLDIVSEGFIAWSGGDTNEIYFEKCMTGLAMSGALLCSWIWSAWDRIVQFRLKRVTCPSGALRPTSNIESVDQQEGSLRSAM